ncbi:DUF1684 domain-containing protein [Glycomyces paridis]|uniref:DUF1684 domain-containing protein n=1 Tax=Glycomyces paridis TaxID=2126555 RepID=A0A4S8P875_9ACTN|nr:DUF1684 domain-containing protein [Glycomyces paridis]THV26433.1 DUF1684 domain-containing protein [Glycomyces paridis]
MTDAFTRDWQAWHDRREAALQEPHGWLSLTALHWPGDEPEGLDGLPGLWSAEGAKLTVTAEAAEGLAIDGESVDGTAVVTAPAWIDHGDRRLEIALRGGRAAVRVRDPQAPTRTGFTGVPAYAIDPAWVVPARFTPEPDTLTVGSVRPGLEQPLRITGSVAFDLAGEPRRLTAADGGDGRLWLLFRDATNGDTTAGFRQLTTDAPAADGAVALDFNRALNMPCAFTDHGTCPLPPPGNALDVPVTAGELAPR